jgi:N4-gp56 family major capsid protein
MAADLSQVLLYKNLPADVKAKLWEKKVTLDARQKNALSEFVGGEKSNMPIIRRQDLSKGGAGQIAFNTTAGNRGRGRTGEQELKSNTGKLDFSAFTVEVDWLRHAISWSRKNETHLPFGGSIPSLTSEVMGDWLARKEEDDYQITLRNKAIYATSKANVIRIGNRSSRDNLTSADTISTGEIERTKAFLQGNGGKPMQVVKGDEGAETLRFMLFAPDQFLRPLRGSASYLQAQREAGPRTEMNKMFAGGYGYWDQTVLVNHNVFLQDDVNGPQGSPLLPIAYLGTAIANGTPTTLTGGGTAFAAGTEDYFGYFEGFSWKLYEDEVTPDLSAQTFYACIYNITTDQKYEIVSYAGNTNTGPTITSVTRGSATTTGGSAGGGNVNAQALGRFSLAHPSGSIIFPCTRNGVPLGWSLLLGGQALYHATGSVEAEPIFHWDDFQNAAGKPFLKSVGLQGIRGLAPKMSSTGRMPNFVVVEGAVQIPGVDLHTVA